MGNSSRPRQAIGEISQQTIGDRSLGRRTFLGLSLATTAGLITAGTAPPANAMAMPGLVPAAVERLWPTRLKVLQSTGGIVRTHNDVYVMTSIGQTATMTTASGKPRLAITMLGMSNQLQIIDPIGGIREKVINLPLDSTARGLVWDSRSRSLFVGVTTGRIFCYQYDSGKLTDLGRVAPKATSLYGLCMDSTGRLWGGSYPGGIIWNYTPRTQKFSQLPRIDSKTDYIRALGITADDTVYVGTGSKSPRVICFPASAPSKRTTLKLPALPDTGFVYQICARGDLVMISADGVGTQLIWNHRTKTLTTAARPKAMRMCTGNPRSLTSYWVNGSKLYATSTTTGRDTLLGELGRNDLQHIWAGSGCIYVMTREGAQVRTHRFDLETKEVSVQSAATLKGAGVGVLSLLAHADGKIYVGGYQGKGISTLNPDTGKRWQSLDTVAPNQICGMIQWDSARTFIGSYGSADVIRFMTPRAFEGQPAFKLMERLKTKYDQSRPFGWAANSSRVFFGTVPEYGLAGGAMGIINPRTDTVERVYNKLIPNHSIVGLIANDKFVFGTTSTRNGYGIPDTKGNAKVFAFDLAAGKLAWVRDVPGHKAVMSPIIVGGKIVAATLEGIVVLSASNGALLRDYSFTGLEDASYRPGWMDVSVKRVRYSYLFVHAGAGKVYVVDGLKGTVRSVSGTKNTGSALAVTKAGRVFVSHKNRGVAEVSI
ncbi:hypothetical protein ACFY5D_00100 [Paeniglutamicibacter sp. NPDC012692]|uniref:hypothetical protein n=1 Tax=Paeniglutamicibacter sp. NPDC012692 TaxID=3364388 RepID=UPI003697D461